jgi:hypothetical protein
MVQQQASWRPPGCASAPSSAQTCVVLHTNECTSRIGYRVCNSGTHSPAAAQGSRDETIPSRQPSQDLPAACVHAVAQRTPLQQSSGPPWQPWHSLSSTDDYLAMHLAPGAGLCRASPPMVSSPARAAQAAAGRSASSSVLAGLAAGGLEALALNLSAQGSCVLPSSLLQVPLAASHTGASPGQQCLPSEHETPSLRGQQSDLWEARGAGGGRSVEWGVKCRWRCRTAGLWVCLLRSLGLPTSSAVQRSAGRTTCCIQSCI